jgi:hypothetical protein
MAMQTSDNDPIVPLYSEWCAHRAEWHRLNNLPENDGRQTLELDVAEKREFQCYEAMASVTPSSMAGIAALAHVQWAYEGPSVAQSHPQYQCECEQPENQIIASIWRSATGLKGWPTETP